MGTDSPPVAMTSDAHRTGPCVVCEHEAVRAALDALDGARHPPLHVAAVAFVAEHADDVLRRVVAEELSQFLLVIRDAVLLDQRDEMARRVARERGAAEIRILRQEVCRTGADVGEVAAAAAGDADLLAQQMVVLDQQHAAAALSGLRCAHHAGGAGADDDDVEFGHQDSRSGCHGCALVTRLRMTAFGLVALLA